MFDDKWLVIMIRDYQEWVDMRFKLRELGLDFNYDYDKKLEAYSISLVDGFYIVNALFGYD